ncbi:Uncharacterised protein [Mycobacteroides abscessus subsp. massiliense]|uniref:hypothetical protein n=1 Tax=Mycobacteroides abscessus TaxID=36809 RepID=UPI00092B90A8|nr:hypothetical protein [Mycobacteroides abscessus]SHY97409.1 Uncharacterised protein [Mycobacteroides abscessus subsp. abscessus]SKH28897.1 Uncharacterised protein [Mycobacteroides abscessus subsp. massiliense]SKH51608.1 Uncharacterised protein [Mycobacteroides abscessus subsp. massiliense]SKI05561.1 Uncharacterised protein [Mycobacteroides abscessus subsp. massiliense]SKJ89941.1 Uncharacterised protein [Mycobacteroides abscessus subsp. massiliense]
MRINACRDVPFSVTVRGEPLMVQMQIGPMKFTASRAEAVSLAGMLLAAVDEIGTAPVRTVALGATVPHTGTVGEIGPAVAQAAAFTDFKSDNPEGAP